ncbi:radical SAM protein [Clostridium botulinum]|nr:radical SAM protein [Clostridium botulinum]AVQ51250.1 radical SAM protein [Clostridium botulinum]
MGNIKFATLRLYRTCNYKCSYCFVPDNDKMSNFGRAVTEEGMEKMLTFFDERGEWHIQLTGGEPTIHPHFIEFCERLSKNHYLNMGTNNSISYDKLREFVKKIEPNKVDYIQCSLQEVDEEEERFKHFLKKMIIYKENNFKAYVSYVAVPDRLDRVKKYYDIFTSYDIPFLVQVFNGKYKNQEYPRDYTQNEIDYLDKYMMSSMYRALLDIGSRYPTCKLCAAGKRRILVDALSGKVFKCLNESEHIGNIYNNELNLNNNYLKCRAKKCSCIFEPHLDVESILYKDFENIFSGKKHYDKELYELYKNNSIANEQYKKYWAEIERKKLEKKITTLKNIFKDSANENIGIYGTGDHTEGMLKYYEKYIGALDFNIFFFNSNSQLWGGEYLNSKIYNPKDIGNLKLNRVIISSFQFQEEIYKSIEKYKKKGINIIKIYEQNEENIFSNYK